MRHNRNSYVIVGVIVVIYLAMAICHGVQGGRLHEPCEMIMAVLYGGLAYISWLVGGAGH